MLFIQRAHTGNIKLLVEIYHEEHKLDDQRVTFSQQVELMPFDCCRLTIWEIITCYSGNNSTAPIKLNHSHLIFTVAMNVSELLPAGFAQKNNT